MESPIDKLTTEQRARLESLTSEVRLDKVTVSFSIEGRDMQGCKKSCFVSETASRGHGAEVTQMHESGSPANWTLDEASLVHCLLSRHVIKATYRDAVHRRIIDPGTAREELVPILHRYDGNIARILAAFEDSSNGL